MSKIVKKSKGWCNYRMDAMPLISIIFYSIPEAYLIFMFGLVIMGNRQLQFLKLALTATGYALCTFVVRLLPFPFGVHAVIHICIVAIIFLLIFKLSSKRAVIATLLSMGTLLVLENTILYAIQLISKLSPQEIWQNSILRTLIGWPHLLVWVLITWVIYNNKVSIFNPKENY